MMAYWVFAGTVLCALAYLGCYAYEYYDRHRPPVSAWVQVAPGARVRSVGE